MIMRAYAKLPTGISEAQFAKAWFASSSKTLPIRPCSTESPNAIRLLRIEEELGDKVMYGATMGKVDHPYGDFRARREVSIWQRLNRILLVLLVIAIWLVIVSLFVPPYKKLMRSRAEIDNLQQQVSEQQNLLARQTREVNVLKTDVTYLETIARDRLDLMKDGETIFRLESARAKPASSDSARK